MCIEFGGDCAVVYCEKARDETSDVVCDGAVRHCYRLVECDERAEQFFDAARDCRRHRFVGGGGHCGVARKQGASGDGCQSTGDGIGGARDSDVVFLGVMQGKMR